MKIYPSQGFRYARNDKQNSYQCHQKYAHSPCVHRALTQSHDLQPVDASEFHYEVEWLGLRGEEFMLV